MLRRVHSEKISAHAGLTICGLRGPACKRTKPPALRGKRVMISDNSMYIIIPKHMPASTPLIPPHRLCFAHLLKPVIYALDIVQGRKRLKHREKPFQSLAISL